MIIIITYIGLALILMISLPILATIMSIQILTDCTFKLSIKLTILQIQVWIHRKSTNEILQTKFRLNVVNDVKTHLLTQMTNMDTFILTYNINASESEKIKQTLTYYLHNEFNLSENTIEQYITDHISKNPISSLLVTPEIIKSDTTVLTQYKNTQTPITFIQYVDTLTNVILNIEYNNIAHNIVNQIIEK